MGVEELARAHRLVALLVTPTNVSPGRLACLKFGYPVLSSVTLPKVVHHAMHLVLSATKKENRHPKAENFQIHKYPNFFRDMENDLT